MRFERCGLITTKGGENIPLKDVKISCFVAGLTASVESIFTYTNSLDQTAEAKFVFPLNDVALYSFEAKIDDRVIVAECRPRDEAKTTYAEAVAKGHTAFIMEQDERCEDIFQMSVGHIPVGGTIFITVKYVGHLVADTSDEVGKKHRVVFTLPSVITPRYSPADSSITRQFESFDGSSFSSKAYTISFEATLLMSESIALVTSARDQFTFTIDPEDSKRAKVVLSSEFKADHDLQMEVELETTLKPFAAIETSQVNQFSPKLRNCAMVQFLPDLKQFFDEEETRTELYFVIDRSGSMNGSRICHAADSLLLFLKSLPLGCRFQIIGFGSTHSALFPEAVDYNEDTLTRGLEYQKTLFPDMGGTEVLPALQAAYESPLSDQGWYRQVIFLTDGDVSNADEIVGLVQSNIHKARLFSIGLGDGASTYLVSAVARAGRGLATFIRDGSELRGAVMKILKCALEPRALPTNLSWNLKMKGSTGESSIPDIVSVPQKPPTIFSGCFSTMFALFDGEPEEFSGDLQLNYEILGNPHTLNVPISVSMGTRLLPSNSDSPLHRLAAKCLLNELGDQLKAAQMEGKNNDDLAKVRKQIEEISCLFNVMCPLTSFVGVDPISRSEVLVAKPPENIPEELCCMDTVDFHPQLASCGMKRASKAKRSGQQNLRTFAAASMYCAMAAPMSLEGGMEEVTEDAIVQLVRLQEFSGCWPHVKDVLKILDISDNAASQHKPKNWPEPCTASLPDVVWMTVLVLAFLEVKHSSSAIEWELVAKKARQFVQSQAKLVLTDTSDIKATCTKLLEHAKEFVRNQLNASK